MKKLLTVILFGLLAVTGTHTVHAGSQEEKTATVFFNEACEDCGWLVKEAYPKLFGEYGYTLSPRDYINERETRKVLTAYNETWGVPFELQRHIEKLVVERHFIGGHVPVSSRTSGNVHEAPRLSRQNARRRNGIQSLGLQRESENLCD